MTFASPLPSVSVPALPLTPYILQGAGRLADKAAFIDGVTGRTMTYGQFEDAVRRQAGGWLDAGLAKGEVVALMAPNCPEYGVTFHAVALAGGVVTTVNPTYTPGEVHHQLVDSGGDASGDHPDVPRHGDGGDRRFGGQRGVRHR